MMTRTDHTQCLVNKIILQNEERRLLVEIEKVKKAFGEIALKCDHPKHISLQVALADLKDQLFDVRERL
jgi:hypothetical protein